MPLKFFILVSKQNAWQEPQLTQTFQITFWVSPLGYLKHFLAKVQRLFTLLDEIRNHWATRPIATAAKAAAVNAAKWKKNKFRVQNTWPYLLRKTQWLHSGFSTKTWPDGNACCVKAVSEVEGPRTGKIETFEKCLLSRLLVFVCKGI